MNNFNKIIIVIGILAGFAFSQEPPVSYFNTNGITSVYIPPISWFTGGTIYFTPLGIISPNITDLAVLYSYKQVDPPAIFSRKGFWAQNGGIGFFGNYYFFQETYDQNINIINGGVAIKLRDAADRKDLVVGRSNGLKVYWNQNGAISELKQDISNAYVNIIEKGNFSMDDNKEDVIVKRDGAYISPYRNQGNGYLENNPLNSFYITTTKFKVRQINDLCSEYGYIQQNPNNKADLIIANGSTITIYPNNNQNGLSSPWDPPINVGYNICDLEVMDVTNDGLNDIIVTGSSNNTVTVYKNIQGVLIAPTPLWSLTNSTYFGTDPYINVTDLNKDGYNDLIFVSMEGRTSIFINKLGSPMFGNTADQNFVQIPGWVGYWGNITKIETTDIRNTGSNALIVSWSSTAQPPEFGLRVMNPTTSFENPPPPPPILQGGLFFQSYNWHPWLHLNNRGEKDWLKYKIYKLSPSTGNQLVFWTDSYGDWVDFSEYVILGGDEPWWNCYYVVKSVDIEYQESVNSLPAYYTVGIPTCGGCEGDNMNTAIYEFDLPDDVQISNFPNPFNPVTKIFYTLPFEGNVKITVYNSLGQVVSTLFNGYRKKGPYAVEFDGSNLSNGVYFYRIEIRDFVQTKKMVLLK